MAKEQTAVFGGGCFWCIEAVFQRLTGVIQVESGYMGGRADQATYRQVCNGDTGHVEVVRITFDADQISYRDLLDVFFAVHDPTTLNQQGNDAGEQYRSVIFSSDDEQHRIAENTIAELTAAKAFSEPIVTAVEPAEEFHAAWRLCLCVRGEVGGDFAFRFGDGLDQEAHVVVRILDGVKRGLQASVQERECLRPLFPLSGFDGALNDI